MKERDSGHHNAEQRRESGRKREMRTGNQSPGIEKDGNKEI